MKSSLVLCVLLGLVLSVRAASVPRQVQAVTAITTPTMTTMTTTTRATTVPNTSDLPFVTTTTPFTTTPPFSIPSTPPPTTTPRPPTASQLMCPEGWEYFQGRCYSFVTASLTWPQAQSNCAVLGSMLTSVNSAQEYGFLQQLSNSNGYEDVWLGGFYLQNQWLWLDGSWFYNTSWSSQSLPDSSSPCLLLNSYNAWSNSECSYAEYPSICAKDSNVPPEMLCPQGWTGFLGRCYYLNEQSLSWTEADTSCALLDASLASVHSSEEYAFLYQQSPTSTWIGGFYIDDQWVWLDGSWFYQGFYTQMSPPDSYACLSTYLTDGWTNWRCERELPSFCVKDMVL